MQRWVKEGLRKLCVCEKESFQTGQERELRKQGA